MATKKKMLQAAAGNAGGAGGAALDITDVFSTYLYEGNGGTQAIENGINLGQSNAGGSGYFNGTNAYLEADDALDFHTSSTDDITIEMFLNIDDGWTGVLCPFGINATDGSTNYLNLEVDPPSSGSGTFGLFSNNPSLNVTIGTYSVNTWHHIAVTYDGSSLKLYKDGTLVTTQSWTADVAFSAHALNIGMETDGGDTAGNFYKGYISNFRVSNNIRYSATFTAPTSAFTSDANTELLTLQGDSPFVDDSTNSVAVTNTNTQRKSFGPFDAAEAGEGGLVWIKERPNATSHQLFNTEVGLSGTGSRLIANDTITPTNSTRYLSSFNSNGFSIGDENDVNRGTGAGYVSWTFRKAPKFFDIVTWTGDGTGARTFNHNLGCDVGMILVKRTSSTEDWTGYHRGSNSGVNPENYKLLLNSTNGQGGSAHWNSTAPTATNFSISTYHNVNNETYVAYLFAHNNGDGEFGPDGDQDIIKCGSYTGTGAVGNFIDLGFEPQWLLLKRTDTAEDWPMADSMRGFVVGGDVERLRANSSAAEVSVIDRVEPNPTGFTLKSSSNEYNSSGGTYIYIAIRRGPLAPPESATEVFAPVYSNNGPVPTFRTGFPVDLTIHNDYAGSDKFVATRLLQGRRLRTNTTGAEDAQTEHEFDYMNGSISYANLSGYIGWNWKRAPGYFDTVAYTGNSTAGRTVSHNLGVAPEMIWVKARTVNYSWYVYHKDLGATKFLELDGSGAENTGTLWTSTPFTDSAFYLNGAGAVNGSGNDYIAYLFASLPGISKVGSYTGNGTSQTIDCGFTSGARFVLVKPYTASQNWTVVDTTRGLIAGNDPILALNDTGSEDTGFDTFDPSSSGFIVPSNPYTNVNGVGYIFYAIA